MKILTILGTRPEVIKLSMVIRELDKHTEHILVHTGQNYDFELNEIFFNELNIRKPDYFLDAAGETASETISNVIVKSEQIIRKLLPDAILLYGDTNSCLAVIAAKKNKIPIFHMEAGNRSFDQRVPEEINRKIVDHLSDINMPLSEHARNYLISEGIKAETIIKIGSPMREVLSYHKEGIDSSSVLIRENIKEKEYFVLSAHREETIDSPENFNELLETINAIASEFQKKILVSTHPRTKKKLNDINFKNNNPLIQFVKPYGFYDYIKLQQNALCVISDSGTITEESSILNFPAITIREAHERPEGMDEGTLIMTGLNKKNVLEAIKVIIDQISIGKYPVNSISDYSASNVSVKVLRIILSYTEYIKRNVWRIKN